MPEQCPPLITAFTEGLFVPTPLEPRLPPCLRYLTMKNRLMAADIGDAVTQLLEEHKQKQFKKKPTSSKKKDQLCPI